MSHRDDRGAERARIEALERELEATRERAERAEAEAEEIKETARVESTSANQRQKREKKRLAAEREAREAAKWEARKRSRVRVAPVERPSTTPAGPWRPEARASFVRTCTLAALGAYGAMMPMLATIAPRDDAAVGDAMMMALALVATLTFVRALAARRSGAPGVANAALVTLLDVPMALGAMALGASGVAFEGMLSGTPLLVARIVSALAAGIAGAVVGARWAADAASSDAGGD